MQSGKLDKRITIQQVAHGKGTSGGNTSTWTTLCEVWAGVKNLSGNERKATKHGGEVAVRRTEFTIRYRSDITELMRILYKGAYYNIGHVNNVDEGNRKLILTCDTGANDG